MVTEIRKILLAEDNPNDVELTLAALRQNHLANEIVVVRDGAEALDYLYRRGAFASRAAGNPAVLLLDLKMPKVDGHRCTPSGQVGSESQDHPRRRADFLTRRAGPGQQLRLWRQRLCRQARRLPGIRRGRQNCWVGSGPCSTNRRRLVSH